YSWWRSAGGSRPVRCRGGGGGGASPPDRGGAGGARRKGGGAGPRGRGGGAGRGGWGGGGGVVGGPPDPPARGGRGRGRWGGQPATTKSGLHARLALLPEESQRAAELAEYLLACKPEELLTIRDALRPHAAAVSPGLWAVLLDAKADAGKRVRAAGALAGLMP